MAHKPEKFLRYAICTRKSTEHGLELEFNSLDAQRDSCEAYIKSQTHEGWRALPQHYDDPAYSGGNLDRPALQTLLKDIDADEIDVVVVYKIDRLTRSLADFAKLVELFDMKKTSFVAVTQQFNTTTSMGRLTLNVLLSFAQFERELSSERVRDKVAASRRKGKWTGGGLPLGYDAIDKKLVVNEVEAKAVRHIYRTYLELKCLRRVATNLREQKIFTKYRAGLSGRKAGGIPFNHGPLTYLLKNRTYVGEIGHNGTWYPGEHEAIIDRTLFDDVQNLLKANSVIYRKQRANNRALLSGLLFDDCGNRMSPTYSTKGEVRYRCYISAARLSGGTNKVGTLPRVSATDLETKIVAALRERFPSLSLNITERELINPTVKRVEVSKSTIRITLKQTDSNASPGEGRVIEIAYDHPNTVAHVRVEEDFNTSPNLELVQAIASAHMYMKWLSDGRYQSIEKLASYVKLHPKVVRKKLRLAFIAPDITDTILTGLHRQSLNLADMYKASPLCWEQQRQILNLKPAA